MVLALEFLRFRGGLRSLTFEIWMGSYTGSLFLRFRGVLRSYFEIQRGS